MEFKHPKYYKELRKRNKSDQAISLRAHDGERERAPDPGLRSYPLSGNGGKLDSLQTLADKAKAPSSKPQASSSKPQATSCSKDPNPSSQEETQASSSKPQAPSNKPQASSCKQQAAQS